MKCSLSISNFLEEISSLFHYIVFFYLHWSLRKAFLSLLAILWNSAFICVYLSFSPLLLASLVFSAICKASSDNHCAFLYFFFGGRFSSPSLVQYYEPPPIVLQALCLSDLIPWIYVSLPLYNRKGFDLGNTQMVSEKAMAPHSSTLAWKIPWMEEPGRLQSMGSLRVRDNWATSLSLFTFMHWRRKWQPTPVFLPGESQGRGSLLGCRLWGCTESDTTEVTAAAAF